MEGVGENKQEGTGSGFAQQDEGRKICVASLLSLIRF